MSTRDCPCDEQPKAEPTPALRVMAAGAKRLEDPWQYIAGDRAAVLYFDNDLLSIPGDAEMHWRPRCAVLNGVGSEVRNGLQDAMFVPRANTIHVALERDVPVLCLRVYLVQYLPADGAQVSGLWHDRDAVAFPLTRQIEKVSDDVLNAVGAAFHHLRVSLRFAAGVGEVLKSTRGEQDRAERIADVVADNRQNPFLEIVGQRELPLTALLLNVLRPSALVDVDTAPDEAGEGSGVVQEGNTAIEDPPVRTVMAAEPVLHFERFPAREMV